MKNEKNIWIAAILNFIVWGSGYYYLKKHVFKGIVLFLLYILIWNLSMIFISTYSILILPIMFWAIFWYILCSIFFAYDTLKMKSELPKIKIKKVKKVVRRSKIRTRKK